MEDQMATTSKQVQAQLPKSDERLWVSDNGDVVCDKHAGAYLSASIASKPKAKTHITPLDKWSAYSLNRLGGLPCEVCVDWSSFVIEGN